MKNLYRTAFCLYYMSLSYCRKKIDGERCGCGEFAENPDAILSCGACDHHRSFHVGAPSESKDNASSFSSSSASSSSSSAATAFDLNFLQPAVGGLLAGTFSAAMPDAEFYAKQFAELRKRPVKHDGNRTLVHAALAIGETYLQLGEDRAHNWLTTAKRAADCGQAVAGASQLAGPHVKEGMINNVNKVLHSVRCRLDLNCELTVALLADQDCCRVEGNLGRSHRARFSSWQT